MSCTTVDNSTPVLLLTSCTRGCPSPRSTHAHGSLLRLLQTGHDIVNAQEHARRLDARLDGLHFDRERVPDAELLHVRQGPFATVDADRRVPGGIGRVASAELRHEAHDVGAAVV